MLEYFMLIFNFLFLVVTCAGSQTTLADYIIRGLSEAEPDLPSLEEEIPTVLSKPLKISLEMVGTQLEAIGVMVKEIQNETQHSDVPEIAINLWTSEDSPRKVRGSRAWLCENGWIQFQCPWKQSEESTMYRP